MRLIGGDANDGRTRHVPVAKSRQAEAKRRGGRLQLLRQAGAAVAPVYRASPPYRLVSYRFFTACFLRQLPEVRRFWDNCAVAFGREPVFRDADAPAMP